MQVRSARYDSMAVGRARFSIAVSIVISCLTALCAETKPNFSGTWKLNTLESDFGVLPAPASRTDVIEHSGASLKISIEQIGAQGTQSDVVYYVTDGQDSMNKLGERDVKSKVFWQGDALVIASIVYLEDGQMASDSVWSLSEDGRTLTQKTRLKIAARDIEQKLVFERTDGASAAKTGALVATRVNYSGVWRLIVSSSDFGTLPGPDVRVDTIEHHDPSITIAVSQDSARDGQQEYTNNMTTDGRTAASHFAGLDAKSSASWVAQNLSVVTRLIFQGSEVLIQTVFVLSEDGKTLTQYSHIKSAAGDTEQKLVFQKQ